MTKVCVIGRSIVMAGKVCGCDLFLKKKKKLQFSIL